MPILIRGNAGTSLKPLDKPATAGLISKGFQAYNANGELITGTLTPNSYAPSYYPMYCLRAYGLEADVRPVLLEALKDKKGVYNYYLEYNMAYPCDGLIGLPTEGSLFQAFIQSGVVTSPVYTLGERGDGMYPSWVEKGTYKIQVGTDGTPTVVKGILDFWLKVPETTDDWTAPDGAIVKFPRWYVFQFMA